MSDTIYDLFPSSTATRFGRRQKRERGSRLPVVIVTGFLGAGKTTLVRRFLETPQGRGTALVVNEFGSEGIDDALLRESSDEVTLLGNGCLCCNTRTDLQVALRKLVADRDRQQDPAFRARADRDQRARRHQPDPADLLHRPRAGRRVRHRGGARRGRRGVGTEEPRQGARGAQAGDPGRPHRGVEERSLRHQDSEDAHRAAEGAQSARRDRRGGQGRHRSEGASPTPGRPTPSSGIPASSPRPPTATAFSALSCARTRRWNGRCSTARWKR